MVSRSSALVSFESRHLMAVYALFAMPLFKPEIERLEDE